MKLRILGCSGADYPGYRTTSFLIDGRLLIDAGVISSVLSVDEQAAIRQILVTHAHIDHVKGIPSLSDNRCLNRAPESFQVVGIPECLAALQAHLFNNILWPDFSAIPSREHPVLAFRPVEPDVEHAIGDYLVTPVRVNHTVPTAGYLVRAGQRSLLFSGDTGPTDRLWELAPGVDALIVEVSFPNEMEHLAVVSKHLTARILAMELAKARSLPSKILVTHLKPQFRAIIQAEIMASGIDGIELLNDGDIFEF